ncbi:MAG: GNAT family N-acetyltransferase [Anaerolineales bacterium]
MQDMLVRLYDLPPPLAPTNVTLRRGLAPEKHVVLDWVSNHFSAAWRSEVDVTFARQPVSCFLAIEDDTLLGFACYDAIAKAFFGPTGVSERARGRGLGTALLLACLHDMHCQGYAYAIIGGVGPVEFYQKTVGATLIEGSSPGIYRGLLRTLPRTTSSERDTE